MRYPNIDNEVYDFKTQIAERELLKAPKVGSWQSMGFTNEELDQIRAAAKEVQADDYEYLEEELWQAIRELFENAEANTNDKLDVVNVIEDEEVRTEQAEKPVVYDIELSTSSTCRTPETRQGSTLGIAKHLDSEGSTAHVDDRKENSPENTKSN